MSHLPAQGSLIFAEGGVRGPEQFKIASFLPVFFRTMLLSFSRQKNRRTEI
jgi:hypothetical protein